MENIIAYAILAILFVAIAAAIRYGYRRVKENQRLEEKRQSERIARHKAQYETVSVPDSMARYVDALDKDGSTTNIMAKSDKVVKPAKKRVVTDHNTMTTTTYTPTTTSSSSDDGLVTGMILGAALNSLMSGSGRESTYEERSAGVTKSESSWGWDDSDSRKAADDTFSSSSWSSSDSSSDSWSSSDSGPSSDW